MANIEWDKFYNVVDGKNRSAEQFINGVNPINREKNWDVPIATQQDVDDAVAAGQKAFESWSVTPIEKRKELLMKYCEVWKTYIPQLTDILVKETGKPRQFAAFEVGAIPMWFHHHNALNLPEETVEDDDKVIITKYKPLGVVAAICPWNFPLILSMGKVIPALLTGCTIIIKPSPFTPYSALKAVEIAQQIFPPGVVQILGGDDRLGPMFTAHPGIAKISFTGSIATGKKIMAACASTLKRVTLELGGNDASIVLPDVDVEKVAPELVLGAFQNSGQVCVATKRIFIHESIYEKTLTAMAAFAKTLKIGNPDDAGVQLGPVQNEMQFERVKGFFQDVKKNGYKVIAGSADVPDTKGFFFEPTIIDNPPNGSRIIEEEPFGPIVPTQPYSDLEEVIARANRTNTGLGACVWGKDVEKAKAVAERLQAGSVFVNSWEKPTPQATFSGWKESGIGGEWGQTGLLAYCNAHAMHIYKQK
ncbi:Aldehyde dehydrogenase [Sphaceloma murrayae]|uniref:aldehyde dehydrogenase (NAD(+)) n=1 Tax=Sphaceloma murrayae TaxID=2082308 RepID=A0A2K1R1Q9_9PEZI|nr:Aldehyde dehydrogenase [Sphaceloma murrayae]